SKRGAGRTTAGGAFDRKCRQRLRTRSSVVTRLDIVMGCVYSCDVHQRRRRNHMLYAMTGGFEARPVIESRSQEKRTINQAGLDRLENLPDSLPTSINSINDVYEMLTVLLDHISALSKALTDIDVIREAADAIEQLEAVDEGENTDSDRLNMIITILRSDS